MKLTNQLREEFGLSQEAMAQYLSVTRSLLSLYELGKRDLPVAAMTKLAEMALFVKQPPAKKNTIRQQIKLQKARAQQFLEKDAKEQEYQQMVAQRKLSAVKKKYGQNMLMLDLLDHLKAGNKTAAANRPHKTWLDMMETIVLEAIEQNGLHIQAPLEVQVSSLRHHHEQARLKQSLL